MTRPEAIRLVESALNEPSGSVSEETVLESLVGWDSVGLMSIIAAFDDKLAVVLPPDQLVKCRTTADLLELVAGKLVP